MATFPRAVGALPRLVTPPRFPMGFMSWSSAGRANVRSFENIGRSWEEVFGTLDTANPTVRALFEAINRSMRQPVLWDVQHPYWHNRIGFASGAPIVGSQFRQVWQVTAAAAFVDETTNANNATASDWPFFPAGAGNNDYAAMGFPVPFGKLDITVGTAGVGTYLVTWEYWNGSAWVALVGVADGTNGFKTGGATSVVFVAPADWAAQVLNGSASLFYVRARRDGGTVTTSPLGTQGFVRSKSYGSSLPVDGAPVSVAGWLQQGDIIKAVGAPVVSDVTAAVAVDAAGRATIPIHPPLFPGVIPADGAAVTVDPTQVFFKAYIMTVGAFPHLDSTRYADPGMTLTWREAPQDA